MSDKEERSRSKRALSAAGYVIGPAFRYFVLAFGVDVLFALILALLNRLDALHPVYVLLSENAGVLEMLCISLPAFWIFFRMYRRDRCGYTMDFGGRGKLPAAASLIACAVCMAVGLNVLILLTPLLELFPRFAETNEEMHSGIAWLVTLYSVLVAPVTEETLFRGVIYRRAKRVLGVVPATMLSAFVFGLFHGNMVQFIYAFLIGLALAFVCERYGTLTAPALFHIAANAGTVFAAPVLGSPAPLPAALIILLAACLLLCHIGRRVQAPIERPVIPETEIGETE